MCEEQRSTRRLWFITRYGVPQWRNMSRVAMDGVDTDRDRGEGALRRGKAKGLLTGFNYGME